MGFLAREINTIFVMLGNGCNMNCRYCLQHPLVHHQISSKINPDIYKFIKQVSKENGKQRLCLQFFGGEPLLYFKQIKEIVKNVSNLADCSIITNVRAMTNEMVDFFNEHDIPVTISWDGYNVLETRGFDVFNPHSPLRRRLLRLNRLGLSAVMSSKAYPKEILQAFQEIGNQYYKLHKYSIRVNIDEIFDTGLDDRELLDMDYERVIREMKDITLTYIHHIEEGKIINLSDIYISGLFYRIKGYCDREGVYDCVTCCCGNGYSTLNMDLDGNLYACHNTSQSIGNIYDPYFKYLNKVIESDNTKERRKTCRNCIAVSCCQGGCKLLSDKVREETYCKLKQAVFGTVVSTLCEYGANNGDERSDK